MTVLGIPTAFVAAIVVSVLAGRGDRVDGATQHLTSWGLVVVVLVEIGLLEGTVDTLAFVLQNGAAIVGAI